jgi:hypothetical protein
MYADTTKSLTPELPLADEPEVTKPPKAESRRAPRRGNTAQARERRLRGWRSNSEPKFFRVC